jgi:hypothetical protein
MPQNATAARTGGGVARRARQDFETITGQPVVSSDNALPPARKSTKALKAKAGHEPEDGEST